jgi:hypothetical protein
MSYFLNNHILVEDPTDFEIFPQSLIKSPSLILSIAK